MLCCLTAANGMSVFRPGIAIFSVIRYRFGLWCHEPMDKTPTVTVLAELNSSDRNQASPILVWLKHFARGRDTAGVESSFRDSGIVTR